MPDTRCWKCNTSYPESTKICVKCGINLVTGQPIGSVKSSGNASADRPSWFGSTLPGLFVPKVALVGLATIAIGFTVALFSFKASIFITMFVGAVGLVIVAQGVTFLICGELHPMHQVVTEFGGKEWQTMFLFVAVPIALFFVLLKVATRDMPPDQDITIASIQKGLQGPTPPPPAPKITVSPYVISTLKASGSLDADGSGIFKLRGSALTWVDPSGDIYYAFAGGDAVFKYSQKIGEAVQLAGSGAKDGINGDDGPAIKAGINSTDSITVDAKGNVYFVDSVAVRKIDPASGKVSRYCGAYSNYKDGNDVPADSYRIKSPCFILFDHNGNLLLDEVMTPINKAACIRKYDLKLERITVVAGEIGPGFAGDGGPAALASFGVCGGIAMDSRGNLYVNDQGNRRIRKIDSAGIISTLAGNGAQGVYGDECPATETTVSVPQGIAVDSRDNVFFGDLGRIRKVDGKGVIHTVSGNGTSGSTGDGKEANSAQLTNPRVLGIDGSDNVYILESGKVRKLTLTK